LLETFDKLPDLVALLRCCADRRRRVGRGEHAERLTEDLRRHPFGAPAACPRPHPEVARRAGNVPVLDARSLQYRRIRVLLLSGLRQGGGNTTNEDRECEERGRKGVVRCRGG